MLFIYKYQIDDYFDKQYVKQKATSSITSCLFDYSLISISYSPVRIVSVSFSYDNSL